MGSDDGNMDSPQTLPNRLVVNDFEACAQAISSGKINRISLANQLQLYGLYSMAKKGPPRNSGPSPYLDPRGNAKWEAWNSQRHLSSNEAMQEYVALVQELSRSNNEESLEIAKDDKDGQSGMQVSIKGFDIPMPRSNNIAPDATVQTDRARLDITHWASVNDHKSVRFCLEKQSIDSNYRDEEGLTALMRAADRNATDAIQVLLRAGADVNAADSEGQTALHYAALCNHAEAAGMLAAAGANQNVTDETGQTPRDMAGPEAIAAIDSVNSGQSISLSDKTIGEPVTFEVSSYPIRFAAVVGAVLTCIVAVYLAIRGDSSSYA